MYYDIENGFHEPEPDIDEEISKLEERLALAEQEYLNSQKSAEDKKKYNYICLVVADNKNRLLKKKLQKNEIEIIKLKSERDFLREAHQYTGAEKLFLCLLCGFATTVFLSPPDILTFGLQLIGSLFLAFLAALTTLLFPKEKGRYWLGSFYEKHPFIYAIVCFVIISAIITLIRIFF